MTCKTVCIIHTYIQTYIYRNTSRCWVSGVMRMRFWAAHEDIYMYKTYIYLDIYSRTYALGLGGDENEI